MSTAPSTQSSPSHPISPARREVRIYSHSALFYWWPVWFLGFLMALLTYFDGHRLVLVPSDAEVRRNWRVEIQDGRLETREGLILTDTKRHLLPDKPESPGGALPNPDPPRLHMAQSKNFGVLFAVVLLIIILISNVPLRGLWSVVVLLFVLCMVVIMALAQWLDWILEKFHYLDIRINAGGYIFISLVLFIIWALTVFVFDRRRYLVVTSGQVRMCLAIGAADEAYDTTGIVFTKRQDDLFRHWIVGLGSGDLIFKTSNGQEHDLPNVLFIGARIKEIERLLKEREVV